MEVLAIIVIITLMVALIYAQWRLERSEQETHERYKYFDKTGRKRTP